MESYANGQTVVSKSRSLPNNALLESELAEHTRLSHSQHATEMQQRMVNRSRSVSSLRAGAFEGESNMTSLRAGAFEGENKELSRSSTSKASIYDRIEQFVATSKRAVFLEEAHVPVLAYQSLYDELDEDERMMQSAMRHRMLCADLERPSEKLLQMPRRSSGAQDRINEMRRRTKLSLIKSSPDVQLPNCIETPTPCKTHPMKICDQEDDDITSVNVVSNPDNNTPCGNVWIDLCSEPYSRTNTHADANTHADTNIDAGTQSRKVESHEYQISRETGTRSLKKRLASVFPKCVLQAPSTEEAKTGEDQLCADKKTVLQAAHPGTGHVQAPVSSCGDDAPKRDREFDDMLDKEYVMELLRLKQSRLLHAHQVKRLKSSWGSWKDRPSVVVPHIFQTVEEKIGFLQLRTKDIETNVQSVKLERKELKRKRKAEDTAEMKREKKHKRAAQLEKTQIAKEEKKRVKVAAREEKKQPSNISERKTFWGCVRLPVLW